MSVLVAFGSSVRVSDQDGKEQTWKLVSSHDASPAEGSAQVTEQAAQRSLLIAGARRRTPRCTFHQLGKLVTILVTR